MTRRTIGQSAIGLAALLCLGVPAAFAQSAAPAEQAAPKSGPAKVRGTIAAVTPESLTLTQKDGSTKTVQLAPQLKVNALVKASMDDIKEGVFIGTTAEPTPEGGMKAIEVHIFPESMRGAGEGHYPWDTSPTSTMTNASISHKVKAKNGQTLTLTYKGGEKQVTVPTDCSIVMVTEGTRDDLKPGASVFMIAPQKPDGTITAGFILVGRGVHPPM